MAYSGHSEPKWHLLYLFLITMTYFVKVTQLNSTDYTIKNTVNAKMTHHINKLYVTIS